MEKLTQLLNEHKDKLGHHMIIDDVAREYKKVILLDFQIDGTNQTFSLNDLIFSTPFLSWLEWKEEEVLCHWELDDIYLDSHYISNKNSDYHKINLALLDTDSERITYINNSVL